tara:strand:+ start:6221 stop:7285 length:1065 start_codon:yes stop_codon:yes gene_type:complete
MRKFKIKDKTITHESNPYTIMEIGVNHENSMEIAEKLIIDAKKSGADAVKFQTYKADKIASVNSPSYWDLKEVPTDTQYKLFKKYDKFNEEDYIKLYQLCKKHNIEFISTPFDEDAVDFLDPLLNIYKISSSDITNLQLLKKVAEKNKPIILSTGASNMDEIKFSFNYIQKYSNADISLLHCILNYPTNDYEVNLNMIKNLEDEFPNTIIGFSDHTYAKDDMRIILFSYIAGARIIEKHFTYDKNLKDNDHFHSMDKSDLQIFYKQLNEIQKIMGNYRKVCIESEMVSRKNARRSLVLKKDLSPNELIQNNHLISKRPESGIPSSKINEVVGRRVNKSLKKDHILQWQDISSEN